MDCVGFLSSSSSSSSAIGKMKPPLKSNWPCHFCGGSSNPDACMTCCICKVSHVHIYCLYKKLFKVPDKWFCEQCKKLSSFQQELPDHLAIQATWKGSFEILDSVLMGGTYEGLQAHLPQKVRRKAYEVANAMPSMLQFKLYPRSNVWPEEFNRLCPTADDIALYFLPGDNERSRKTYRLLSDVLMTRDSAIKSSLNGWELLIFSSKQLPTSSQRMNKQFFLWGVFQSVGKHYSSSQALVRTQRESVSSAICNYKYGSNNDSLNIIKGDDFVAIKMEPDIVGENNDQRIDKAVSNSCYVEKKRKVGGDQGRLLTPKTEQPGEFDSPPGFTTPITNVGYATSPALVLEAPPGFMRPITNDGYATSPALLLEGPPGFITPIKPKERGDSSGYATSPALLLEAPPGFSTRMKPKERGDSSVTNQKLEESDTMDINALWHLKRKRTIRGTATSKYLHDSSFQPQKSTKVTESPKQDELLPQYHKVSNHGCQMHSITNCKPFPGKVKEEEFDGDSKDLVLYDTTPKPIPLNIEHVKDGERWITEVSNENNLKEDDHRNDLKLTLRYDENIGWRADP